ALSVPMDAPLSENATFYVQLVITPDVGTNVAYSYGSVTGLVGAGNASFLYVPPASNVTLRASPATFIYSFASWRGTGMTNSTKPTSSIVVDGPSVVTNASSYNVPVLLALAIAPIVGILIAGLWFRSYRRKRAASQGFSPGST
ncbi:MAG: hypothetical protein ACRD6W_10140, partial [Nitrososphaerales archaeon]